MPKVGEHAGLKAVELFQKIVEQFQEEGVKINPKTLAAVNNAIKLLQENAVQVHHAHGIDQKTLDSVGNAIKLLQENAVQVHHAHGIDQKTLDAAGNAIQTIAGGALLYGLCSRIWSSVGDLVERQSEGRRTVILNDLIRGECPATKEEFNAALDAINNSEYVKVRDRAFENYQKCVERRS